MLTLFIYFLWFLLYIFVCFFYKIIFFFFKKKNYPNFKDFNHILKFLLIAIYNKKKNFLNKIIPIHYNDYINIDSLSNKQTILFFHNLGFNESLNKPIIDNIKLSIDFIFRKKIIKTKFKEKYKLYYFTFNNDLINLFNINKKIEFIIIYRFLCFRFNIFLNKNISKIDKIITLLIFKKSIFNQIVKITKLNENNISNINIINVYDTQKYLNNNQLFIKKKFKKLKYIYYNTIFKNYMNIYKTYYNIYSIFYNYIYTIDFKNNFFNVYYTTNLKNYFKNKYLITFSPTNLVKYISNITINKINILYLRKNKIFNKSRYSRNRQTYRTGVYWCLYINIIAIIAFYFWFYKFTINFGYLWWLLFSFIFCFFFVRALKYRFYKINNLITEFILGFKWFFNIIINILISFNNINICNYLNKIILINLYYYKFLRKTKKFNKIIFFQKILIYNYILQLNKFIGFILK